MVGSVKQIRFRFADLREIAGKARIDVHVTGRARAASTANRKQLVDSRAPNRLHHRYPDFRLYFLYLALASRDNNLWHYKYGRFPMRKVISV